MATIAEALLAIVTLTTNAMKDHGKVIPTREKMQVWIERDHTCLASSQFLWGSDNKLNMWRIEAEQGSN